VVVTKVKTIGNGLLKSVTDHFRIGDTCLLRHVSFDGNPIGDACLSHLLPCFLTSEMRVVITGLRLHIPITTLTLSLQKAPPSLSLLRRQLHPLSLSP
jgi:hypothetical protein